MSAIQIHDKRAAMQATSTQGHHPAWAASQLPATRRINPKWLAARLAAAGLVLPPWVGWTYYAFTCPRILTGEWEKNSMQDGMLMVWVLVHAVLAVCMGAAIIENYWHEPMWKKDGGS